VKGTSLVSVVMADFVDSCLAELEENDRVKIERIEIVKDYDADMPSVLADSVQLSRVFVNLVINACEAMPDGGRMTIITRTAGSHAEIEFKDTGMGIEDDNLRSLFDPLFTTKIKGTGLGLAICNEIVGRHGGEIQVASTVGVGTSFTVRLPLEGQVAYKLVLEPKTEDEEKS
jgi:two-component system NtrC family sensor kinase